MPASREAFNDGEIPANLIPTQSRHLEELSGEWTIIGDNRSDGMTSIMETFGMDPKDRLAWEFSHHLNAPRMRLEYTRDVNGTPVLTVTCHDVLSGDCSRSLIFDGVEKSRMHLKDVVPHSPVHHMAPGFDEGTLVAAEIDGILFVKYKMSKGTFFMTRALLTADPVGRENGPITLAKYCVLTEDGEKHEALRYHKKLPAT